MVLCQVQYWYCIEGNFRKIKFLQNLLIIVFRKYIFGNSSRFKIRYVLVLSLLRLVLRVTASLMEFTTDTVIRGHQIYKEIWTPIIGECVECVPETGNGHDLSCDL